MENGGVISRTGSVHHSVSHVSPRPTMRSDGAQLFHTIHLQIHLSKKREGERGKRERESVNEREGEEREGSGRERKRKREGKEEWERERERSQDVFLREEIGPFYFFTGR